MLSLVEFTGNSNLGVFARATETHVLLPHILPPAQRLDAEQALEVKPVVSTIGGTNLLGSLTAANRHGVALSDIVTAAELRNLERSGLNFAVFEARPNAMGNNILVTDKGGMCNPAFDDEAVAAFQEFFQVPFVRGTLGGHGTVGMAGIATALGVLVHPKATPEEREEARRVFGHEAMIGTVNHGMGLVGAGLVANSKGALIGRASTAIEINRIEDALGFLPVPEPRA